MFNQFVNLHIRSVENELNSKVIIHTLTTPIDTKDRQLIVPQNVLTDIGKFVKHGFSICCDQPINTFVVFQIHPTYGPGAMFCKDCASNLTLRLSEYFIGVDCGTSEDEIHGFPCSVKKYHRNCVKA